MKKVVSHVMEKLGIILMTTLYIQHMKEIFLLKKYINYIFLLYDKKIKLTV